MARLIACALAATALAALALLGVLNSIAVWRGEESFGVLGFAFLALGVLAPVCVGLFLVALRGRGPASPGSSSWAGSRSSR